MRFQAAISLFTLLAFTAQASPVPGAEKGKGAEAKKNGTEPAAPGKGANNSTAPAGGQANGTALVLPDGRIKQDAKPEDFNVLESVFKSAVVKGDGLKFSDLVVFPNVSASLFDKTTNTKPFEITLSDKSIFVPKGGAPEATTRRADLLPSIRSTLNDVATTGVRTMHFSVQADPARKLNTTHAYQVMFLESKDFSFHQLDVRTGADNAGKLVVTGNSKTAGDGAKQLFSTDFPDGSFQNFALKMDFNANTVQVFHSSGDQPLKQATEALPNDLAGNGEYHFALLKNSVGTEPQPTGINEGIIFGGIFMEDSTDGKVTLQ